MSSNESVSKILDDINNFRNNPSSIVKEIENFSLAANRLGANTAKADTEKFVSSLKTMKPLGELIMNDELTEIAQEELERNLKEETFPSFKLGNDCKGKLPDKYIKASCCIIADDGADKEESVLKKLCLNKTDRKKIARKCLTDKNYIYIGLAQALNKDGEQAIVMILSKYVKDEEKKVEKEEKVEKKVEKVEKKVEKVEEEIKADFDISELKQAFDLFDVNETGTINPNETCEAMKSIGFDVSNPEIYSMMSELCGKNKDCSWPTFSKHFIEKVSNKFDDKGLRTIFNLYVEDPKEDTITVANMKRICKELGEKDGLNEINKMLKNKGGAGTSLTFDEFKNFMNNLYRK